MYAVMQMGLVGPERYETREAAQDAADALNAEMAEECGYDYGDGAATVVSEDEIPDPDGPHHQPPHGGNDWARTPRKG